MLIHEQGIEIKRNSISRSIVNTIKNEVSTIQGKDLKPGIRAANKKFLTINQLADTYVLNSHELGLLS